MMCCTCARARSTAKLCPSACVSGCARPGKKEAEHYHFCNLIKHTEEHLHGKQITRRQILGAAPASLLLGSSLASAGDGRNPEVTIIGALLSLTGDWSSLGLASRALLQIAADEINDLMAALGQNHRFKLLVEDTQL